MWVLDHIAVAAENLEAGTRYVEETLGVSLSAGGKHAAMGTHNRLLGLADGLYLEVIAIDPEAPAPDHPRWFDLDRFSGAPRIANWICRNTDTAQPFSDAPTEAGEAIALSRGDLAWQMAVPTNGILPLDGAYPALLKWEGDKHPAAQLPMSGLRLRSFTVSHPQIDHLPQAFRSDPRVRFQTADTVGFVADFEGPQGCKTLR